MEEIKETVTNAEILTLFDALERNLLGRDPGLPVYYWHDDIESIIRTYEDCKIDFTINTRSITSRWKTTESLRDKLYRHLEKEEATKFTCNDWFGCCCVVRDYSEIDYEWIEECLPVQFTHQHSNGYNAIHAYLYESFKVPIEVQFHSVSDHIFNVWNRNHNYKVINKYGDVLRSMYEQNLIHDESEYLRELSKMLEEEVHHNV